MPSPLHNRQTHTLNSTSFLSSKFHFQVSLSLSLSLSLDNCCLVLSSSGKLKPHKLDCRQSMKIQQNSLSSNQKTLLQPADLSLSLSPSCFCYMNPFLFLSFFLRTFAAAAASATTKTTSPSSQLPTRASTHALLVRHCNSPALASLPGSRRLPKYVHTYVLIHTIHSIYIQ